jgi:uncharacterized protein RhaS with RHS repeats
MTSCGSSPTTGQVLADGPTDRLSAWQNVPSGSPSSSGTFAYDGAGQYADAATGLDYYSAQYYDPLAQ